MAFFVLFAIAFSPFYQSVHCDDVITILELFACGTINLIACSWIYCKVMDYLDEDKNSL